MNLFLHSPDQSINLQNIIQYIHEPLSSIEQRCQFIIESYKGYIQEMSRYVLQSKGKRFRAALVLLSAQVHESHNYEKVCDAALAIELLHTATLLHDDVNDNATMRRGVASCHRKYGQTNTILFGDFLFSQSFILFSRLDNINIVRNLSQTTASVCEGEILQNLDQHDWSIGVGRYLEVVGQKTASLIGESCRTGALMNEDKVVSEDLYQFGINLGMAFQIYDDYLDFKGNKKKLGKTVFQDLQNGYVTLPIIYLLEQGDKDRVVKLLNTVDVSLQSLEIQKLLEDSGALEKTLNTAQLYIQQALHCLDTLENPWLKETLKQICMYSISREQ